MIRAQTKAGGGAGEVVIWGASGHAKVLAECIAPLGYRVAALFDNRPILGSPLPGVRVYRGWEGFEDWRRAHGGRQKFLVAIGGDRGRDRLEIHDRLEAAGLTPMQAIHRTAFVATNATLGPGSHVLANSTVGVETRIGKQCIINTNASVDHECVLGNGVHVAPGATLAGCVEIGDCVLVGAGAVVLPRIRVGAAAVIGAGAVVTADVPARTTVVGNPARPLRKAAA